MGVVQEVERESRVFGWRWFARQSFGSWFAKEVDNVGSIGSKDVFASSKIASCLAERFDFRPDGEPRTPFFGGFNKLETDVLAGNEEDDDEELESSFELDTKGVGYEIVMESNDTMPENVPSGGKAVAGDAEALEVTNDPTLEGKDQILVLGC